MAAHGRRAGLRWQFSLPRRRHSRVSRRVESTKKVELKVLSRLVVSCRVERVFINPDYMGIAGLFGIVPVYRMVTEEEIR